MKIGIDLGTTLSVLAKYDPDVSDSVVIPGDEGTFLTPSVIDFSDPDNPVIGSAAYRNLVSGNQNCIADFKKNLGRDVAPFRSEGREFTSEDMYRMMYGHLVKHAIAATGESVDSAVITVPAYFDDIQRRAAKQAATDAGITVTRVINEPTAAAIEYGYRRYENALIMVLDIGGGTTDATICSARNGLIQILDSEGDHHLGGNQWNEILLGIACARFENEFGFDPMSVEAVREKLIYLADSYKKVLSASDGIDFEISCEGFKGTYHITREEFEEATQYLVAAVGKVVSSLVLDGVPLTPKDVTEVLLVGGSTRLPSIRPMLESLGYTRITSFKDIETDTAVAKGAALVAALYAGNETGMREVVVKDTAPHSLGFLTESDDGSRYVNTILIPKGSAIPTRSESCIRIRENNTSDRIEIYILQGESTEPKDCTVISKWMISGFPNDGDGMVFDLILSYDVNGMVEVSAEHSGYALKVTSEERGDDFGWMALAPSRRDLDTHVAKEVAFVIDMSKSMWKELDKVKESVRSNAEILNGENTGFTLIGFADRSRTVCGPGADLETLVKSLDYLKGVYLNGFGTGTNSDPLEHLYRTMDGVRGAHFAALFTDGCWDCRNDAVFSAEVCRNENILVYAFGFGSEVDESFLRQIATLDGNALHTTADKLKYVTDTIAVAIRDNPTGLREAI